MPISNQSERLQALDQHFRAANYLSAAQLYLRDNVLLKAPLKAQQIKPRLLGHWGTTPGINLIYTHLNRLVQDTGSRILLVCGTGHGAPAVLSCLYLEGTLGKYYPQYPHGAEGLAAFVRSFSWPGGFPSHLTAQTPGAIHEGGELGYSLLHAHGAAFDRPELIVACIIGDGEAETGPLAASWHSPKFVDARTDGAVLPILHLNGYKLSGPSILARMPEEELMALLGAHGYRVYFVSGDEPFAVHRDLWQALDLAHADIRDIQRRARQGESSPGPLPRWPLIVLRTPKGWTGPKTLDGTQIEGSFHSHQIPISDPATNPGHLAALDAWLRSYRPETLFDADGKPTAAVSAVVPAASLRIGCSDRAQRHCLPLLLPSINPLAVTVDAPGGAQASSTETLGTYLRDIFNQPDNRRRFRLFCPDETNSNKLGRVFEATARRFEEMTLKTDEGLDRQGLVMEVLSEHLCEGWLEGYLQTGRHGVLACYEAFISIIDSMMFQYAKWQKLAAEVSWRPVSASLNFLLTSHVWEQDHNGYSHQGPTFINALLTKKSSQTWLCFPPDANTALLALERCLESRDRINLIVASKKPMQQWLSLEDARRHLQTGASIWAWAGDTERPAVILAGIGDVPTREIVAAAQLLRGAVPDLPLRVVNVVDLLALASTGSSDSALGDAAFAALFGEDAPVVLAFHGYPMVIHELIYRRPLPQRFHVHGYREEGTTTTPFDMLVRNDMSRYQLAIDALARSGDRSGEAEACRRDCERRLQQHARHIVEHGEDMPEIRDWRFEPVGLAEAG